MSLILLEKYKRSIHSKQYNDLNTFEDLACIEQANYVKKSHKSLR